MRWLLSEPVVPWFSWFWVSVMGVVVVSVFRWPRSSVPVIMSWCGVRWLWVCSFRWWCLLWLLWLPVSIVQISWGLCVHRRISSRVRMPTCWWLLSEYPVRFCTIFYPALSVHWEIVRHRFGFCSFRLYSILSWTFLYSGIEMGSFGSGDRYCFFSGNFCLIVLCIHVQAFSDTERGSQRA